MVSPADPGLAPEVLKTQMEDAKAKLVICCVATLEKVRRARDLLASDVPIIVMDEVHNMNLDTGRERTVSTLCQVTWSQTHNR